MTNGLYEKLLEEPLALIDACYDDAFRLTYEQIGSIHLRGIRKRFREMRPKIPMLDKLAKEQGIDEIRCIDDAAPLLFTHTVYKSYPMSYLERCQFDKLTRWLNGLTTEDLSGIDASGVTMIDDWFDLLDSKSSLRVFHTSGTTGKLSFLPRTKDLWRQSIIMYANVMRDWRGPNSGPDMLKNHRPLIVPSYRYGAGAAQRGGNLQVELFAGGEENALFMYPEARFSADVASLAGRLRVAESRGEQGAREIAPALLARRAELIRVEKDRPEQLRRFFAEAQARFGGKDVYIGAVWTMLYDCAIEGLQRGVRKVFGPGSVLRTGGGKKGKNMPDNWRELVVEFLGFENFYEFYGISEQMSTCMRCEDGNYHLPPVLVPFLLDPATGIPLPRQDGLTGRFASLDLLPNTYWGGFVTGDEVTLSGWEKPCTCGRTGPFVHPELRRYSEAEGGDDKIICSGAPEAHDHALAFLSEISM